MVTETGQLEDGERIAYYLDRVPSAAGAMTFAILENYLPQIPRNKERHRSGGSSTRLNIAALLMNAVPLQT